MDASSLPVFPSLALLTAPGLRLLTGPRSLLRAGLAWTVAHLPPPAPLVVVDGGESFDTYLLAEVAAHLGEAPRDLLARVHVARAFTAHQFVSLVEAGDAEVRRLGGRHALVLAPLDLLYHGDLPAREAAHLLERLARALEPLGRAPRSVVVVCPDPPSDRGPHGALTGAPGEFRSPGWSSVGWSARAGFVERLAAIVTAHYRFDADQPASLTITPPLSRRSVCGS
jgi:hypothetical protein